VACILLLEPDVILSNIYTEVLQQAGYDVCPTFDAQKAINTADECSPDLVILELQLPVHNGIEFIYEYRSYTEWEKTPVIVQSFVSPNEFKSTPYIWHELGIVKYFYKPHTSLQQLLAGAQEQLTTIAV